MTFDIPRVPAREKPDLSPKVRDLPHRPGVYMFRDRLNRVIYVGKARDLHRRVSQYFHPSRRMAADLKTRALIEGIWDLETHVVRSEAESILLEGRLIKEYRPKYNVSFRDDKRFLLVRVNLSDPLPRLTLTRVKKDDGARYFGPFAHSGALRSTLNLVKKRFGLRSCRPLEPGERDYKHCLDHIIRQCSAPCVGKVSREGYRERVLAACEFLEGESRQMAEELGREMRAAAERLDFERAAALRNLLSDLEATTRPMRRRFLREEPTTVVPERDIADLREALGLPDLPMRMECFDISNISATHKVASMVVFRDGRADRAHYRRYRIQTVEGQDDFASMREVVYRRYRHVLGVADGAPAPEWPTGPEGRPKLPGGFPDLIVIDGGKGHLNAALDSLRRLGVRGVPVIGLAKEREEIFLPGRADPLVLPHEAGALRLLQRIRDEAHRFANAYHQLLLRRRVSESVLDECPGMSATRKAALLRAFGSVARLRKAGAGEIAAVPGIGRKGAEAIVAFLQRIG